MASIIVAALILIGDGDGRLRVRGEDDDGGQRRQEDRRSGQKEVKRIHVCKGVVTAVAGFVHAVKDDFSKRPRIKRLQKKKETIKKTQKDKGRKTEEEGEMQKMLRASTIRGRN